MEQERLTERPMLDLIEHAYPGMHEGKQICGRDGKQHLPACERKIVERQGQYEKDDPCHDRTKTAEDQSAVQKLFEINIHIL